MKFPSNLVLPALIAIVFTSCVSQKKYQEALNREQSLLSQNTNLSDEIVRLKGQVENLQKDNARMIGQIDVGPDEVDEDDLVLDTDDADDDDDDL